jgi:hypothetical protein
VVFVAGAVIPAPSFFAVTFAPAMAPPFVSTTTPLNVPVVACAGVEYVGTGSTAIKAIAQAVNSAETFLNL